MVSGGKEKIFDGNGEEMGGWEKSEGNKIKGSLSGIHVHHVRKFTKLKLQLC